MATSGAESLNRTFASSREHIRFLSGQNLMPFLFAKAIFVNMRARLRDSTGRQDVEGANLILFGM